MQNYIPEFNSVFVYLQLKQQSVEIFKFHPQGICYYVSGVIACPPSVPPSSISMCTIYYCVCPQCCKFWFEWLFMLEKSQNTQTCSWSLEYFFWSNKQAQRLIMNQILIICINFTACSESLSLQNEQLCMSCSIWTHIITGTNYIFFLSSMQPYQDLFLLCKASALFQQVTWSPASGGLMQLHAFLQYRAQKCTQNM